MRQLEKMRQIGKRIRGRREELGYSMQDVIDKMPSSSMRTRAGFCQVELGLRKIDVYFLIQLAEVLEVDFCFLVFGKKCSK